jgi:hypothetical protein
VAPTAADPMMSTSVVKSSAVMWVSRAALRRGRRRTG